MNINDIFDTWSWPGRLNMEKIQGWALQSITIQILMSYSTTIYHPSKHTNPLCDSPNNCNYASSWVEFGSYGI